jgi:drug/metabolite transporter (DMT)-like permease
MIPLTAIALLSIALFSVLDAILGYLTNILLIPVYESICIRMVRPAMGEALTLQTLVFFLAFGYVLQARTPDAPFGPPPIRGLMWIRGCLLSMGLITGYSSLRYLTISEFLTIFCCLPFPTGLLCWMFLGEEFTRVQMICCCKYPHYISRYLLIFRHLHARSSNDY